MLSHLQIFPKFTLKTFKLLCLEETCSKITFTTKRKIAIPCGEYARVFRIASRNTHHQLKTFDVGSNENNVIIVIEKLRKWLQLKNLFQYLSRFCCFNNSKNEKMCNTARPIRIYSNCSKFEVPPLKNFVRGLQKFWPKLFVPHNPLVSTT